MVSQGAIYKKLQPYTLRELFGRIYFCLFVDFVPMIIWTLIFKIKSFLWGVECGKNIKVWGSLCLIKDPKTKIKIGNNVLIVSSSARATASALYSKTKLRTLGEGAEIIIKDNVKLSGASICARSKTIKIGQGAIIAPNVIIVDSDFHSLWPPEDRVANPGLEADKDVIIGENVWLGLNTIILKGTSIGNNSVIGAGSVVRGNIPPNCVAAGNPAKVIRELE